MIIDSLKNANTYFALHPLFQKAFEFIQSQNLETIEVGKYEIADGLKAIVSNKDGMSVDESIAKFECHNRNIDIQLCIKGNEKLGWKPRKDCLNEKGEYNDEKDVAFYNDAPDMFFQLTDDQFAIFFPDDVHAPMIGEGPIKKMVIKVTI